MSLGDSVGTQQSRQLSVDSGQCAVNRDGEASVRSREVRVHWPVVCPSREARPDDCRLTTDYCRLTRGEPRRVKRWQKPCGFTCLDQGLARREPRESAPSVLV